MVGSSAPPITWRVVWLLTGGAWAARSLLAFAHPDYQNPVTTLDWSAVWMFSAALVLVAPSVVLLSRLAPSRSVRIAAAIVVLGALTAGVANAIEDGVGVSEFGRLYVVGFLSMWLGLLALAAIFGAAHRPRLSGLSVALFVGVALFTVGGGLIVLAAWSSLAVAPGWFAIPGRGQNAGGLPGRRAS